MKIPKIFWLEQGSDFPGRRVGNFDPERRSGRCYIYKNLKKSDPRVGALLSTTIPLTSVFKNEITPLKFDFCQIARCTINYKMLVEPISLALFRTIFYNKSEVKFFLISNQFTALNFKITQIE
jgi:hypothetical protein